MLNCHSSCVCALGIQSGSVKSRGRDTESGARGRSHTFIMGYSTQSVDERRTPVARFLARLKMANAAPAPEKSWYSILNRGQTLGI